MIPLQKNSRFRQGIYTPKNANKYIGNGSKCIYRSGLELKFMRFCDSNSNVKRWSSESIIIPYISPLDNRVHKYHVDNYVEIQEGSAIRKYLVEIKPYRQTLPPTTKYKKKEHLIYEKNMFSINTSKWNAARAYCKQKGYEFLILTEKDLG